MSFLHSKRKWIAVWILRFIIEWVYIIKMKISSNNEKMLAILFYLSIINSHLCKIYYLEK